MEYKSLITYFSDSVKKFPNKPAIIADNNFISYQELHELSNYVAECILQQNVSTEEIIPIIFERSLDMVIAMLALLKSGCAFLPINPVTPCERLSFILKDSNAQIVLTNDPSLIKGTFANVKIINLNNKKKSANEILNLNKENNLAYVMYTSGSTGNPKGVLIEHVSMINLFLSLIEKLNLTESEKILALTDYTFDISLIELLLPLMIGATIILTEKGTIADGLKIKKYITQYDVSLIQATPISWEILLKHEWHNNGKLKILVGGEKFSARLAEALDYQKGNVFNMYGPTETSMWSMYYSLGEKLSSNSVPLGNPLANTTIYLLDENLLPVPRGKAGQIYIGGRGLARGYLNNFALTQEKFIIYPETGERLYKTGDLAIREKEDLIYFISRVDDQFKLNGVRIEAGEIEKIIEQEDFIKKAIVKIHEKENYYKILSAYVEIDEAKIFNYYLQDIQDNAVQPLKNVYNSLYSHAEDYENETINTCGWKNTFTGKEFHPEELKESYQFIESVISKSNLNSVLEVGSGSGYILKKFINSAKKYTVLEISEKSLDYIKSQLDSSHLKKTIFKNESIIHVNEDKKYSCIIVNSVIQYLPSVRYLILAIKKLVKATMDGGTIIIGDIRSLELMELFLLKKNKKLLFYKSRESEMLLSQQFFIAIRNEIPEISHVDISVKHGIYKNELNYFRHDIILHIRKSILVQDPVIIHYDQSFNLFEFKSLLKSEEKNTLILKNIQNLINGNFDNDITNIDFILKNEFHQYEKFVHYDLENPSEKIEIHFYPKSNQVIRCPMPQLEDNYQHYCREPFNPWIQEFCFNKIKHRIAKNLISWMRPSVYIWVEKWPLTSNGKIDKKLLELTTLPEKKLNHDNNILSRLEKIWESTTSNSLESKSDLIKSEVSSLYLYFFLATVNEIYGMDIGYHELERYNTLFSLASYIEASRKETV